MKLTEEDRTDFRNAAARLLKDAVSVVEITETASVSVGEPDPDKGHPDHVWVQAWVRVPWFVAKPPMPAVAPAAPVPKPDPVPRWLRRLESDLMSDREQTRAVPDAVSTEDRDAILQAAADVIHGIVNGALRACGVPIGDRQSEGTWNWVRELQEKMDAEVAD